ncbi:MAG: orotate phosphoribosyltransferase [Saprospiraceae bacterium]|nr:orotate phosphoribosyltransferase [Saprospiraceae bacterium]MCB0627048.1 orotate phosphoribosyltransferase [Saprospiraceae bacterium]MCB0678593.1 orotate phosphoribosyltransferase [Saprospiraceae bacterium]MCB0680497.1 orotate phosphoribosyltransferase [Saprospiraceae bacterium]
MNLAAEVARKLLQIKAIKLSPQKPFTWASGIQSPIYCDNRIILSFPSVRNFIKQALTVEAAKFGEFDAVAGVATAGIAHGMLLADAIGKPFAYVRSKPKEHGRQNQVEGRINSGERVLVVEDLISTGGSSLQAVEVLREAGCEVVGVLAIFSYGFDKAERAFAAARCPFRTLSNYETLIRAAMETGDISGEDLQMLTSWRSEMGAAKA